MKVSFDPQGAAIYRLRTMILVSNVVLDTWLAFHKAFMVLGL